MQRCPAVQAAPPPQRHVPVNEQLSAMPASQLMHAPPTGPQATTDRE